MAKGHCLAVVVDNSFVDILTEVLKHNHGSLPYGQHLMRVFCISPLVDKVEADSSISCESDC